MVLDGVSAWFLRYDDVSDTDDKAVVMGWGATQVLNSRFIIDLLNECINYYWHAY